MGTMYRHIMLFSYFAVGLSIIVVIISVIADKQDSVFNQAHFCYVVLGDTAAHLPIRRHGVMVLSG